jgi:hypothetical protein
MDDVGVWDRCLTDAEVQSLYTYGTANGKGYPWATFTNTTIVFQGDARLMYETDDCKPCSPRCRGRATT